MTYPVVRVLQHKPAVDLRPSLGAVRVNVGLGQLALHLPVDEEFLNDGDVGAGEAGAPLLPLLLCPLGLLVALQPLVDVALVYEDVRLVLGVHHGGAGSPVRPPPAHLSLLSLHHLRPATVNQSPVLQRGFVFRAHQKGKNNTFHFPNKILQSTPNMNIQIHMFKYQI